MKTAKDGKFPVEVSEGRVTAKIHKVTKTKNGKIYTSYVADYVLLGQRKQVVRADFDEAKQIALDACRLIAGGQQMSLTLVNGERVAYYRLKDEERLKLWGKSVGTTIQVGVTKIRHGDNNGRATLIGSIITEAKK